LNKHIAAFSIACIALSGSMPAIAGPFGDEMSKCMVRETTDDDKTMLVRWAFSVIALHPKVRQMAAVRNEDRAALNRGMADLMMALLVERCARESREALKNEGPETLKTSFGVLGRVAMQGLFADPDVTAGIAEFARNLDEDKLKKIIEAEK
jgi:hypothetical protein